MTMKKIATLLLFSIIINITSFSQNKDTKPKVNENFSIKSQYLFNTFVDGKIYFVDGTIKDKSLNYNVIVNEMHYIDNNILKTFSNYDFKNIIKITIKNHEFIFNNHKLYEIIFSSDILLLKSREPIFKSETGAYGTSTNTSSVNKMIKVSIDAGSSINKTVLVNLGDKEKEEEIKIKESFKFLYKQKIHNASRRFFYNNFSKHKKNIKSYIKDNKINFGDTDKIIQIIKYSETL